MQPLTPGDRPLAFSAPACDDHALFHPGRPVHSHRESGTCRRCSARSPILRASFHRHSHVARLPTAYPTLLRTLFPTVALIAKPLKADLCYKHMKRAETYAHSIIRHAPYTPISGLSSS